MCICIYTHTEYIFFFQILFHYGLSQDIGYSSLCCTVGLPWWLRWSRIRLQFRRPGFSPWLERSPGEGIDCPLQCSCLENRMDREVGSCLSICYILEKGRTFKVEWWKRLCHCWKITWREVEWLETHAFHVVHKSTDDLERTKVQTWQERVNPFKQVPRVHSGKIWLNELLLSLKLNSWLFV